MSTPVLDVRGLAYAYPDGHQALFGVDLHVHRGERVALLGATTTVPELLRGLERLHMPRPLVAITSFMIRYGDVITDDMRRMKVARQSRGYDPRWLWQVRAVATSAGALFIRSYERGERVYVAMLSRGYDGALPDVESTRGSRRDWLVALAGPAAAAVVCLIAVVTA